MLIRCPECGKEISDKAESCPNCGCPVSEMKSSQETSPEKKSTQNICPKCEKVLDKYGYCPSCGKYRTIKPKNSANVANSEKPKKSCFQYFLTGIGILMLVCGVFSFFNNSNDKPRYTVDEKARIESKENDESDVETSKDDNSKADNEKTDKKSDKKSLSSYLGHNQAVNVKNLLKEIGFSKIIFKKPTENENEYYFKCDDRKIFVVSTKDEIISVYADAYDTFMYKDGNIIVTRDDLGKTAVEYMEDIDWDENYKKADEAGKNAADWMNEMFAGE